MAKLKDWLKINDSGILKNVAKRKRQRDVTMLELFGTPVEQEMLEKERKRKEALRKQLQKKNN